MIGIYTIEIPMRPTIDVGSEIIPAAFTGTHALNSRTDKLTWSKSFRSGWVCVPVAFTPHRKALRTQREVMW